MRMRLQVFSDIHLECEGFVPEVQGEVVILAGDIHTGTRGIEWAAKTFSGLATVIYVAGNHEFYGQSFPDFYGQLRKAAMAYPEVYFLEQDRLDLGGVRFLGTTLWTDFAVYGDEDRVMEVARVMINDYIAIDSSGQRDLQPDDVLAWHRQSRQWLEKELREARNEEMPVVVITHHGPAPESIPACFQGDRLTGAFCSDLRELMHQYAPQVWVHGHTHDPFDYQIGQTRVVCHPIGYPEERRECRVQAAGAVLGIESSNRSGAFITTTP